MGRSWRGYRPLSPSNSSFPLTYWDRLFSATLGTQLAHNGVDVELDGMLANPESTEGHGWTA